MRQPIYHDASTGIAEIHLNRGRPIGGVETQQDLDRVTRVAEGKRQLSPPEEYCVDAYRRSARGDGRMLTLAARTYGVALTVQMCREAGLEFNDRDAGHLQALVDRQK